MGFSWFFKSPTSFLPKHHCIYSSFLIKLSLNRLFLLIWMSTSPQWRSAPSLQDHSPSESIILLSWFIHWSFNYLTLYHLLNGLQCIFHEDTDLMALSPVLNTVAGTEYSSNIYLSNECHWLCWNKLKACPLYADWHDHLSPEMSAPLSLMNLLASFLTVPFFHLKFYLAILQLLAA